MCSALIAICYLLQMYSSMAFAAALPAPMALMTVAAPVTASPPAYTPSRLVLPSSPSVTMQPCLLVSKPGVVERISGLGLVPDS